MQQDDNKYDRVKAEFKKAKAKKEAEWKEPWKVRALKIFSEASDAILDDDGRRRRGRAAGIRLG